MDKSATRRSPTGAQVVGHGREVLALVELRPGPIWSRDTPGAPVLGDQGPDRPAGHGRPITTVETTRLEAVLGPSEPV